MLTIVQINTDKSQTKSGFGLTLAMAAKLGCKMVSRPLPGGIFLPTEAELQLEFGVSRTVVSEAVRHLAENGFFRWGQQCYLTGFTPPRTVRDIYQ
jgi:DNA-binding FadR family transcriptional regulator